MSRGVTSEQTVDPSLPFGGHSYKETAVREGMNLSLCKNISITLFLLLKILCELLEVLSYFTAYSKYDIM